MTIRFFISASFAAFVSANANADDAPNYDDHIKPIFREHCLNCHGDDKQKADLNLQNYASMMQGGSGGAAIVPGRSSQSLLFQLITDPDEDSRMPPDKKPIPKDQIDLIQKWIDAGVKKSAASKSGIRTRDTSFVPPADAARKPLHPPMPSSLPELTLPKMVRPLPVLSMAASPWAPLLAVSGQQHVRVLHSETGNELGKLPFPEGVPHVIRFSQNGEVLMVAGGQPVQSGAAVLYDVKSGSRLATIGDEVDAVLAADISPDQSMVALGGSGKLVKVYSTQNGKLKYRLEKHTDWITAVSFSPDGKSLATADRAGAIHIWDADRGGIRLSLVEHNASVRALSWRSDSKFLASAGEDGRLVWWDMEDGWPAINKANVHPRTRPEGTYGTLPNGVLAISFGKNGHLITTGRDGNVRLWDDRGKELKQFELKVGVPISGALIGGGTKVVAGDSLGKIHFWEAAP